MNVSNSGVDVEPSGEPPPKSVPAKRGSARRDRGAALRVAAICAVALVLLAGISVGGAEYYTSRPDFCASCHIMGPYYNSWSHDVHGSKLEVRCVDCHYAPGEKFTLRAKFKGLSQVTSYFSGRFGAGRPRAHVDDASCLRSGCHGDQAYLTKALLIGERRVEKRLIGEREVEVTRSPTVKFYHDKHMRVDERLADTGRAIADARARLRERMPADAFDQIARAVVAVGPAAGRSQTLRGLLRSTGQEALEAEAFELMRLEHLQTRLRQLEGLTCAACHSYDPTGARHVGTDRQTCYTCHFTNEAFNHQTGECLKCHEPPVREIVVHDQTATSQGAGPALMNHQDIVARKIDCASCHLDVIAGETKVTARECTHCHDQDRYLKDFDARTTETVAEYHRVHVAAQRARCTDCHGAVRHQLIEPTLVATSSGFLQPVINECQHCHPNHHHQQVQLLMGTGGEGVTRAMPNAMFGSRVNCRACHTQPGSDFKGEPLIEATRETCVACHSEDYRRLFEQWMGEIESYLKEADAGIARVNRAIEQRRAAGAPVPQAALDRLAQAEANVRFVRAGNGIHNKNYSLQLLDVAVRQLDAAMIALAPDADVD